MNPLALYFKDNPELTTEGLAKKTNIPYNTISNLRTGRKKLPDAVEAIVIARETDGKVPITSWEK